MIAAALLLAPSVPCGTPDCVRQPRPGWAKCETCVDRHFRPARPKQQKPVVRESDLDPFCQSIAETSRASRPLALDQTLPAAGETGDAGTRASDQGAPSVPAGILPAAVTKSAVAGTT
jgi:hypothetical protein